MMVTPGEGNDVALKGTPLVWLALLSTEKHTHKYSM